jgi:hypothetical protein
MVAHVGRPPTRDASSVWAVPGHRPCCKPRCCRDGSSRSPGLVVVLFWRGCHRGIPEALARVFVAGFVLDVLGPIGSVRTPWLCFRCVTRRFMGQFFRSIIVSDGPGDRGTFICAGTLLALRAPWEGGDSPNAGAGPCCGALNALVPPVYGFVGWLQRRSLSERNGSQQAYSLRSTAPSFRPQAPFRVCNATRAGEDDAAHGAQPGRGRCSVFRPRRPPWLHAGPRRRTLSVRSGAEHPAGRNA